MKHILFFFAFGQAVCCFAQKTLSLTEAEQQLQKNNLLLLADQYNISAAQAGVIQARIWELPYMSAEFNAVNPQNNNYFDVGNNGQKGLAIQQLIYLGGKKKNEVAFAKSNVSIAELQFEQLLRTLNYQLRQTFYTVYFDNQKVTGIESKISILDTLLNNYTTQANKGNIPLKEVVRLQALVFALKTDLNTLHRDIIEAQQTLSLLTGITEPIIPTVNEIT
jgi:outer membrane protein, heavy metal efflux system